MKVEVEHSQEVIANIKTGADLLVEALAEHEVDTVFGYPGGAVLPIYDALYRHESSFKHILCRHE
ncbi:MAG: thiamine pyrophosphate-binding protein, partial [Jeotgalicoccus sp.]|nr:thiamine pyrophosphate-binding protein [Jeotgalicoccus sp.]